MSFNNVCGINTNCQQNNRLNSFNNTKLVISRKVAIETAQHLYGTKLVPDDISVKQLQTLFDTAYIKKEFKYRVTVTFY